MGANFQDDSPDSLGSDPASEHNLQAWEEALRSQFSYARTLIQYNRVPEALSVIAEAEESAQGFWEKLPADVRYLPHFLRGRAYLQQVEPALAQPHLEAALGIVAYDEEAAARVRNLLGVVYLEQHQPDLALKQHLKCLDVALAKGFKDQDYSFRLSVYRNLASDYLATNNISQAIDVYKRALAITEYHHDLERQAGTHWGLAMAYKARNEWPRAMAHGFRSVKLYESIDDKAGAASAGLQVAEMLIDAVRYSDARRVLSRTKILLDTLDNSDLMSYYYIYQAELARQEKKLQEARRHAAEALEFARRHSQRVAVSAPAGAQTPIALNGSDKIRNSTADTGGTPPNYLYAEALSIAAMVEEDLGHKDAADRLFQEAVKYIGQTGFRILLRTISWKYAKVLEARGAYDRAVEYHHLAASTNSSSTLSRH